MRSLSGILYAGVGLLLLLLGGFVLLLPLLVGPVVTEATEKHAANVRRHLPAYLSDLRALHDSPVFPPLPSGTPARDAGPVLNVGLPYYPADGPEVIAGFKRDMGAAYGVLQLPDGLRARLSTWKKDWVRHADDDLPDRDFSWMTDLRSATYWDLFRNSPRERMTSHLCCRHPLPDLTLLLDWSKLRLLAGMRRGDPAEAAADVRQLARLANSTESVILANFAYFLLLNERDAYDKLASQGTAPAAWSPLSREQIDRFHRVAWASTMLTDGYGPVRERDQAREAARGLLEVCAGMDEGADMVLTLRPLLRRSLQDRFADLDDLVTKDGSPCLLPTLRRLQAATSSAEVPAPDAEELLEPFYGGNTSMAWLKRSLLPSRSVAHMGTATSLGDPFRFYP